MAIRRVEHRVRLGGHSIPANTIRRRYQRGLEHLHDRYLPLVDEWAIYDGSRQPPCLLETGNKRHAGRLMEDASTDSPDAPEEKRVQPLDDPDFIGAEEAVKRASEKALARALAAGLEPVVRVSPDKSGR